MEIRLKSGKSVALAQHESEFIGRFLENASSSDFKTPRSLLFMPLNKIRFVDHVPDINADAFIFDLEDSVPASEKESARKNIQRIVEITSRTDALRIIRVNSSNSIEFTKDLREEQLKQFDGVMLSKVETRQEAELTVAELKEIRRDFIILPAIETARGILNADQIMSIEGLSKMLAVGYGDLSLNLGIERKSVMKSPMLRYALEKLVISANANAFKILTAPWRDISAEGGSGLREESLYELGCGVSGKFAIHPSQIDIINDVFSQHEEDVMHSINLLQEFASKQETNAISVNGEYAGFPSMKTAALHIKKAQMEGLLEFVESAS